MKHVSAFALSGLALLLVGCASQSSSQPSEAQLREMLSKPPAIPGGGSTDTKTPPPGMAPAKKPGAPQAPAAGN